MITREEFDNLKQGDVLICGGDEFKVNHVVNDVAVIMNKYNTVYHHSFWELKNFSFKTKPKYKGRAVKCDSVEQANWLQKRLNPLFDSICHSQKDSIICVYLTDKGWDYEEAIDKEMYEIISFSQYYQENNITEPKWFKGFEVKKGYNDIMIVSGSNNNECVRLIEEVSYNCFIDDIKMKWINARYPSKGEINPIKFVD